MDINKDWIEYFPLDDIPCPECGDPMYAYNILQDINGQDQSTWHVECSSCSHEHPESWPTMEAMNEALDKWDLD